MRGFRMRGCRHDATCRESPATQFPCECSLERGQGGCKASRSSG
ncbi:hypothetical protein MBELCI_0686 [Limimaricola cinnabarinus LL-001]|uniref:Uncharacterized protein n=1 Tax=Limimaricola cinnabarinus LL-001 TaxID=1337093 RepID=U3AAC0_9RHOB|nr:hypothetical protein MBELCI_0686 [Limimaricola cinnabarinus LL-001]